MFKVQGSTRCSSQFVCVALKICAWLKPYTVSLHQDSHLIGSISIPRKGYSVPNLRKLHGLCVFLSPNVPFILSCFISLFLDFGFPCDFHYSIPNLRPSSAHIGHYFRIDPVFPCMTQKYRNLQKRKRSVRKPITGIRIWVTWYYVRPKSRDEPLTWSNLVPNFLFFFF